MNKFIASTLMVSILAVSILTSCSTSVVETVGKYIQEFLPVAEIVANLVLATENPAAGAVAKAIESKINAELQEINVLVATYNSSNAVTVREKIIAISNDVRVNLSSIEDAANVTNPTSRIVIDQFVVLGNSILTSIINTLPPPNASVANLATAKVKSDSAMKDYKIRYNQIISTKTGDPKVDRTLAMSSKFQVYHWKVWHPAMH